MVRAGGIGGYGALACLVNGKGVLVLGEGSGYGGVVVGEGEVDRVNGI